MSELLPCGRDRDGLVAQVADGRARELDPHQRGCPYCRAALAELESLWSPVVAVAAHRPSAPDGVVDEALRRLHRPAESEYARLDDRRGRTTVGARVVVVLARHLAAGVPGVRAALSRVVAGGLEITLAATYGVDLAALGERIRITVAHGVREHTGLEPSSIRVVIDDVLE